MENLKVKEHIEICEELGVTFGSHEAWAEIEARREKVERPEVHECEEDLRRERHER